MDAGDWVTLTVVSAAIARLVLAVADCFFNVWESIDERDGVHE